MIINILLILFVIVTWGYSWVLMKTGLDYLDPFTFSTVRCGLGAISLLPFLLFKYKKLPAKKVLKDITIVGIFQTTLMFGFLLYGMQFVTAGKSAVLLYTMPIWTSLYVHFYLRQKLNRNKWKGLVFGTVGILCILGWDTIFKQDTKIIFGETLIIIASISWATSNVWAKKNLHNVDPFYVNGFQLLLGTLGLAGITFFTIGFPEIRWNGELIYILAFTGLIASAINFSIWFYLIKKIDINITTFSSMLVPVCSLVMDWWLLGNNLDAGIISGGAFIIIALYYISKQTA